MLFASSTQMYSQQDSSYLDSLYSKRSHYMGVNGAILFRGNFAVELELVKKSLGGNIYGQFNPGVGIGVRVDKPNGLTGVKLSPKMSVWFDNGVIGMGSTIYHLFDFRNQTIIRLESGYGIFGIQLFACYNLRIRGEGNGMDKVWEAKLSIPINISNLKNESKTIREAIVDGDRVRIN